MADSFFFYPGGIKDALEVSLVNACSPDDLYGIHSNHVLCDLEDWLENERRVNAVPVDLNGIFTQTGIACEILDEYIYKHLMQFFGTQQISVIDVRPMSGPQFHFLIEVEFN